MKLAKTLKSGTTRPHATRYALPYLAGIISLGACLSLLQGCVVGPRYVAPVTQAPPAYKEVVSQPQQSSDGTTWVPATPQDAIVKGNWWEIY